NIKKGMDWRQKGVIALLCLCVAVYTFVTVSKSRNSIQGFTPPPLKVPIKEASIAPPHYPYEDVDIWKYIDATSTSPFRKPTTQNTSLVIYNRIPKCGSTTLLTMIKRLQRNNSYNAITSSDYFHERLKEEGCKAFVRKCSRMKKRTIFNRHIYYVPFGEDHKKEPVYINMIRDPVEHAISSYYFYRHDSLLKKKFSPEEKNMSLQQCLSGAKSEQDLTRCNLDTSVYPRWFCGHSDACLYNITYAIEKAIYNIDNAYTFIGVTEQYNISIQFFEKLLPEYFRGAWRDYVSLRKPALKKTSGKIEVSTDIKDLMKSHLAPSYVIYNYILKKFKATVAAHGL
ncbi:unnamed protein product, partial [Owenia fusiformis]